MKIDVTKIEGYETMTVEEKLAALEGYDLEVPESDGKWKNALDKAAAEAAKYKRELKEKMTEAERLEAERKEADEKKDARLRELEREKSVAEFKSNFLKVGYSEDLANTSSQAVVDGDYSTVFSNLTAFISERDKKLGAELLDKTPRPNGGDSSSSVTKEQFGKMSFKERNEIYNKNPELYKQLTEKGE